MSEIDFASGTGYNALLPTVAEHPVLPLSDLEVTNPPETPLPIALQIVPTIAALSAQGGQGPVLLQADAERKLIVAADNGIDSALSSAALPGDITVSVYSTNGFTVGRIMLYIPLGAGGGLAGPTERHKVTGLTVTTLTLDTPIRTAGTIGSLAVLIPLSDAQPPAYILATQRVTSLAAVNLVIALDANVRAVGLMFDAAATHTPVVITGLTTSVVYNQSLGRDTRGPAIYDISGSVEQSIRVQFTPTVQPWSFYVIAYTADQGPLNFAVLGYPSQNLFFSTPAVNTAPFMALAPLNGQRALSVVSAVFSLRNGGGAATAILAQIIDPTGLGSIIWQDWLSIPATNGSIDRITLTQPGITSQQGGNGLQFQTSAAPGALNFASVAAVVADV